MLVTLALKVAVNQRWEVMIRQIRHQAYEFRKLT